MKIQDVRRLASMPLQSPTYPRGPYRFEDRQYMILSYRTDPDAIRAALPEPLEPDGDTVSVVKDLKVKGRPTSIKIGTKVRNIRLVYNNGDHDIDCKIDGFGAMYLKSTVVKKI